MSYLQLEKGSKKIKLFVCHTIGGLDEIKFIMGFSPLLLYRGMEQLVARQPHKLEVVGSNPIPATIIIFKASQILIIVLKFNFLLT